jgi:hypothetical protein
MIRVRRPSSVVAVCRPRAPDDARAAHPERAPPPHTKSLKNTGTGVITIRDDYYDDDDDYYDDDG